MKITRVKDATPTVSPLGLLVLLTLSTNLYIISFLPPNDALLSAQGQLRARPLPQNTAEAFQDSVAPPQARHQRKLQEEVDDAEKPWPKPTGWENLGFYDIRKHFECKAYAHDDTKPLPSMKDWEIFRQKFKQYTDTDDNLTLNDPVLPTKGYSHSKLGSPPPYYAAHSPGKGRGLFASRDIKKGELVHDGGPGDIIFPNALAWRRFIFNLPRNKACDMIDWTWTQQMEKGGDFRIFSALNISILVNTGKKDGLDNISPMDSYCDKTATYDFRGGMETCSSKMYATRDIKKDEEILLDYHWYPTVYHKVGLGKGPNNDRKH